MADPTTTPGGGGNGGSAGLGPGRILAGHEIRHEAGRGGMGTVYAAMHLHLRVLRALKVLDERAAADPVFRARFELESQLAAALDHPNVVQVYEAGESEGRLYLSMRFVDGPSLAQLLAEEGPLSLQGTVELVDQVAAALDEAHVNGLVHRDVKPANILLSAALPRHAYLGDFGISRLLAGGRDLTQTGETLGTVNYVAPEQIAGEAVGTQADIYSLACVAYEALTGTPPFARSTQLATMFAHANDARPDATGARPDLPTAVAQALARGLARDPGDRHERASELARELREAASGSGRPARARPARRPRRRSFAVAATAAAAAAVAVVLLSSGDGSDDESPPPAGGAGAPDPVVTTIDVQPAPTRIAVGELNVWTASAGDRAITAIVPAVDGVARPPTTIDARPAAIVVAFGSVWVADRSGNSLVRLDPGEGTVPVRIPVGRSPSDVAVSASRLWVTNRGGDSVSRVDPATNQVDATIPVGDAPTSVAIGEGGVWVADSGDGTVTELDPASGEARSDPVQVGGRPAALAAGEAGVWVVDRSAGRVVRIGPGSREVSAPIAAGSEPLAVTTGFGYAWVSLGDGSVRRIDPARLEPVGEPTEVGAEPVAITVGKGFVWTADRGDSTVSRIQPR